MGMSWNKRHAEPNLTYLDRAKCSFLLRVSLRSGLGSNIRGAQVEVRSDPKETLEAC